MSLLNLSLPELLGILTAVSGLVVTLYLLDRVRQRRTVASLKFFNAVGQAPETRHRRHIQQPWSLLLQLISLALLLLAAAQIRFGPDPRLARSHILILDTSAWMSAQSARSSSARPRQLMDESRAAARRWLATLPPDDRVMLVRADSVPSPVTPFESDRETILRGISESQPGAAVLSIGRALQFASQTRAQAASNPPDIVFAGAARTVRDELPAADNTPSLRMLRVEGPVEHYGLRRVGVRRSPSDPDVWDILVSTHNYGVTPKKASLVATFGGAIAGSAALVIPPHSDQTTALAVRTRAAGPLELHLTPDDVFTPDHHAFLELPAREFADVAVYTEQPELLRPIFESIHNVRVSFHPVSAWNPATTARIVVLDRFAPAQPPAAGAIWIDPPAEGSPVPVASTVASTRLRRWRSDHELGAGLHTHDVELRNALVFRPGPEDITIAEADAGPVIVARTGSRKSIVVGFHPLLSDVRYELATPLLFANAVRWLAPQVFRRQELSAASAGGVQLDLDSNVDPASITVSAGNGEQIPWTLDGRSLRLFSAHSGVVHVSTPDRDLAFSLTLPDPGDVIWSPRNAAYGLPASPLPLRAPRETWYWLALLGAVGLLIEWLLYARGHKATAAATRMDRASAAAWKKAS